MADKKLTARDGYNGYAVLELNQVAFPRDGRIEAQLPLDATVFARATGVPAEVGMILKVNKAEGKIEFAKTTGNDKDGAGTLYALNYSTEHMYDERLPQLKNFCQYAADSSYDMLGYDDFYPRLGYLAVGDRFTTNAIVCDEAADVKTLVGTYLTAGEAGYWVAIDGDDIADAVAPVVQIVEGTTCPNGIDPAVKVVVVKA